MMQQKKTIFLTSAALLLVVISAIFVKCGPAGNNTPAKNDNSTAPIKVVPVISYSVVKKHPHDASLFTEGFLFNNGKLLESTGSPDNLPETRSLIGEHNLENGKFVSKAEIDRNTYFGEGIVVLNNYIYQLTYTNQIGFIYDAGTYQRKGQFNYTSRQGWGMTTDGQYLIMSDGTNAITYLNPKDFSIAKTISVTENGFALDYINELEFVNGSIYANVWMTNFLVKIDTASGEVTGKLDLTALFDEARREKPNIAETNGVAFSKSTGHLFVTGKLWPSIYEIKCNL